MKTFFKRFSVLAAILALSLFAMTACTPEETSEEPPVPEVTAITASANGVTNVRAGQSVILTKSITPKEATAEVTWEIVEGASAAAVAGDVLVVNANAETGAVIKVKAVSGEIESNLLTFTVGIPLEKIELAPIGSLSVVKGNTVGIDVALTPSDATNGAYTWEYVEGREYAEIKGNTLVVFANAETGAKITVKAVSGEIESEPLTFTVLATQEETNAERYFIDLSADSIRLDKKGSSAPTLFAEVYNRNYDLVTDKELSYTVVEGAQYLSVSAKDGVCSFTALGHGVATVEVRVVGTDVAETVTVDVIVPPEAIDLPEVFKDRPLYTYNFSYINHSTNEPETLPFVPTPRGELVCKDLVYSFEHESGDSGDSVAVYENGAITFKKLGKVTVTVTSSSGSRVEATATYTFNINDGYNVYNYTELRNLVYSPSYDGQEINVVVLEKPDGSATGYTYGYDLVPPAALKADPTVAEIYACARIQAVNKSLHLNGNKHKIDASQLRPFTVAEYNKFAESDPDFETSNAPTIYSLFSVEAWTSTGEESAATKNVSRSVYLHDFEVVGNCPIDYGVNNKDAEFSANSGSALGVYSCGISIGSSNYTSHYYIDVDNVTASAFQTGIRFSGVVNNGTASNLHAYNCYSTGILVQSSIMTLKNLTFGPCGATGIEISPDFCEEAGLNDNENQSVSLVGKINASTNLNDGNTMYFQKYTVAGVTIPFVIDGNCAMYTESQLSHIRKNGQYCFVALKFNNLDRNLPNTSELVYPAFQEGGIVDITSLPTDGTVNTTHQYIRMEIIVTLPTGAASAGTALFYNMNYKG